MALKLKPKPKRIEVAPTARREFDRNKTVYFPYMCDHAYALVGALAWCGIKSELLPPHDEKTLEYGRRYSSGGECLPFILTTGEFLKLLESPGFDPKRAALFMPTSCGPCRFGQYYNVQRLIFSSLGYEVDMISVESYDSYTIRDLGQEFRKTAWYGLLAVDLLQKLLWKTRPYEVNKGETDRVHREGLISVRESLAEGGRRLLLRRLEGIISKYKAIPIREEERPLIGIVGEIYIRANDYSNSQIVRMVEGLGGEVRVAPICEWFYYTNRKKVQDSLERKEFFKLIVTWLENLWQLHGEKEMGGHFSGALTPPELREPRVAQIIQNSEPYIKEAYRGEPVLDVGKAVDYIAKGAAGIINTLPFSCMPGTMVSSVSTLIRKDHGNIPWLNLTFDGQKQTNLKTRLEAFLFQARRFAAEAKTEAKIKTNVKAEANTKAGGRWGGRARAP